jgi:2,3-dihydroxybenzoate-AMP ligase
VSAGEVEDVLLEHPAVRRVAIVAMPDEYMGERSCAFVVPQREGLDLNELREYLRTRGLADYKLPDRLEKVESLPHTKIGKIDKAVLRATIAATMKASASERVRQGTGQG